MEMLSRGMASSAETTWKGKIECDFHSDDISLEGVRWFVNITSQLTAQISKIDFGENKLDGSAVNLFSELVPNLTELQVLSFWDNPIGNGGAVKILKCLNHCKTPLKELNLQSTGVGEEDCVQVAMLIANTDLERLDVSGNGLSSNSVASIMESVLQNRTIQQLRMGGSHFSEEKCKSLASHLQQTGCQLRKLDISKCSISDEGAVHLAEALTNNHSLRQLNISGNQIGDIGATGFGDMLSNNKTVIILYVNACGITSEGCVQLAAGLTGNATLQQLWIGSNDAGMKIAVGHRPKSDQIPSVAALFLPVTVT